MAKKETGTEPKFITAAPADGENPLLELFKDGIMDIYWAENHLVKNLPKMINAANSDELKTAIGNHLEETKGHVTRLEEVFGLLDEKIIAKKCDAMEGLTKEGEGIVEGTPADTDARDVGIIMASQKVEHYEIATYGGLASLATTLGLADVASLLEQTLAEEKAADDLLTQVTTNITAKA
ncbi:ferritin-like domain-containing protein [Mucilaginibacter sp.]|uniref:ferritin-like domain-containing protein n=1 Tax=Mucilaginibacter sp. TaxID=1882438 RepID=UPI0035BBDCAF